MLGSEKHNKRVIKENVVKFKREVRTHITKSKNKLSA